MLRITIEQIPIDDNLPEEGQLPKGKPIVFEIEHSSFVFERGIKTSYPNGIASFSPNGQSRLTIKGWSGCPSYDEYISETTTMIDEEFPIDDQEVISILDRINKKEEHKDSKPIQDNT